MRRICSIVAVVLAMMLVGGPAWAGANISVEGSEDPGENLTVKAFDCESGQGFDAFVEVELVDPDTGDVIKRRQVPADDDGSTKVKIRIPRNTESGRYIARVRCIHEFDDGSEGTFYISEEFFEVL